MEPSARGPERAMRQYLAHALDTDCTRSAGSLDRFLAKKMNNFPPPSSLEAKASRCLLFEQLLSGGRRKQERLLVPDLATNWFRKQKVYVDKLSTKELADLSSGLATQNECYMECSCGCLDGRKPSEATEAQATQNANECVPLTEPKSRNPFLLNSEAATKDTNEGSCNERSSCSCLLQAMSRERPPSARQSEPMMPRLNRKYDLRKAPQRRLDPTAFRRISPEFFSILDAYETAMSASCPLYGISMHHWGETTESEKHPCIWAKEHFLGDDSVTTTAVVSPYRLPGLNRPPEERSEEEDGTQQQQQQQQEQQRQQQKQQQQQQQEDWRGRGMDHREMEKRKGKSRKYKYQSFSSMDDQDEEGTPSCNNETCPIMKSQVSFCCQDREREQRRNRTSSMTTYSSGRSADNQSQLDSLDDNIEELQQELQKKAQQQQKQLKQQQQELQQQQQELQQQQEQLQQRQQQLEQTLGAEPQKLDKPLKKRRDWRNFFRQSPHSKYTMACINAFTPALPRLPATPSLPRSLSFKPASSSLRNPRLTPDSSFLPNPCLTDGSSLLPNPCLTPSASLPSKPCLRSAASLPSCPRPLPAPALPPKPCLPPAPSVPPKPCLRPTLPPPNHALQYNPFPPQNPALPQNLSPPNNPSSPQNPSLPQNLSPPYNPSLPYYPFLPPNPCVRPPASSLCIPLSAGCSLSNVSVQKKSFFGGLTSICRRPNKPGQHLLYNLGTNFHQFRTKYTKKQHNKPKRRLPPHAEKKNLEIRLFSSKPPPCIWTKGKKKLRSTNLETEMQAEDSSTTLMPPLYDGYTMAGIQQLEEVPREEIQTQVHQEQEQQQVPQNTWQQEQQQVPQNTWQQEQQQVPQNNWQQEPPKIATEENIYFRKTPSERTLAGFAHVQASVACQCGCCMPEAPVPPSRTSISCQCGCATDWVPVHSSRTSISCQCGCATDWVPVQTYISCQDSQPYPPQEAPAEAAAKDPPTKPAIQRKQSTETDYGKCGYKPRAFYLANDYHQLMRRYAKPRASPGRQKRKKVPDQVPSATKLKPKDQCPARPKPVLRTQSRFKSLAKPKLPKRPTTAMAPKQRAHSPRPGNDNKPKMCNCRAAKPQKTNRRQTKKTLPDDTTSGSLGTCKCNCLAQAPVQAQSDVPSTSCQDTLLSSMTAEPSSFSSCQCAKQNEAPASSYPTTSTSCQPISSNSSLPGTLVPSCSQKIPSRKPSSLKKCVSNTQTATTVSVGPPRQPSPPRRKPCRSPSPPRKPERKPCCWQAPKRTPVVSKKPIRKRATSCDSSSSVGRTTPRERSSSGYRYRQFEASVARRRQESRNKRGSRCAKDRSYYRESSTSDATATTKEVSTASSWSQQQQEQQQMQQQQVQGSYTCYCSQRSDYGSRGQQSSQSATSTSRSSCHQPTSCNTFSYRQDARDRSQGEPSLRSSLRCPGKWHPPSTANVTIATQPSVCPPPCSTQPASSFAPTQPASSFAPTECMAPGRRYYTDTQPGMAARAKFSCRSLHTTCSIRALSSNTDSVRCPCAPAPSVASVEPPPPAPCMQQAQHEPEEEQQQYYQYQEQHEPQMDMPEQPYLQQQQQQQQHQQQGQHSCPARPAPSAYKLFNPKPTLFKNTMRWEEHEHRYARTRLRTNRPPPPPRTEVYYVNANKWNSTVGWQGAGQRSNYVDYNNQNAFYYPQSNYQQWSHDPYYRGQQAYQTYPNVLGYQGQQQFANANGQRMDQDDAIAAAAQGLRGLVQALGGPRHKSKSSAQEREADQQARDDYSQEMMDCTTPSSCYNEEEEAMEPQTAYSYTTGTSSGLCSDNPNGESMANGSASSYLIGSTASERTWGSTDASRLGGGITAERPARERRRGSDTGAFISFPSGRDFRAYPSTSQATRCDYKRHTRQTGGSSPVEPAESEEAEQQPVTRPTPLAIFLDELKARHDASSRSRPQQEARKVHTRSFPETSSSDDCADADDSLEVEQLVALHPPSAMLIPATYTGLLEEQVISEYLPRPRYKRRT